MNPGGPSTIKPKILVVDDDAGLLRLMEKALKREGFAVSAVPSGAEARKIAARESFSLLLVDLRLADMTGQELLAQFSAEGIKVPFVVITGQGDERVAVEMMKQGALDYLVKDAEFLESMPTRVSRAVDIVRQRELLATTEAARRELEKQILEIIGREQRRFGQDLHDGLGQHLTGIELLSQCLEQSLAKKKRPEAEQAATIARHVRDAIKQTKNLARGLSPVELEQDGLRAALKELCRSTTEFGRVKCECVCPEPMPIEENTTATHLYRIAQEAVNNAVKHGHASEIRVSFCLSEKGKRQLSIKDNGTGFAVDQSHGGMGLGIMKYRASVIGAELSIESTPGQGTEVRCRL